MTTFTYTGAQQTYVVPSGVTTLTIECWGAQGADYSSSNKGGLGGYAKANLPVAPGETLYVFVGGAGSGTTGGWNGGGSGCASGYGGGGMSDVRQGGNTLTNQVVVAGGGGGGGAFGTGGTGGGTTGGSGSSGTYPSTGGTQTTGGTSWSTEPQGARGQGASENKSTSMGGGGGGYYGGGCGGGGGGGSGYVGSLSSATMTSGVRSGGGQVVIRLPNSAPNAPTLTNPANATTIDRGATQRFTVTPNDPDTGDGTSGLDIQYRTPSGSGAWTLVSDTTGNTYHDFPANEFSAATYGWQARTYDTAGAQGAWSAEQTFTAADKPTDPTITDPVNGQTITGPNYVAHYTDGGTYTDSEWRTVADNAGSPDGTTVYWSSGSQGASTSVTVPFATDGRYEHLQVRVYNAGWWSNWASVRADVNYLKQGSSTGGTSFAVSATGAKQTRGTATGGYVYAAPAASGSKPTKGATTLGYSLAISASATSTPNGTSSGSVSFGLSATGKATHKGSASPHVAYAVSAVGAKPPGKGTATLSVGFAGTAHGGVVRLMFTPPVHDEPMPTRVKPFCFFVQPVSFAVVMRNGHFQSVRTPSQDETTALTEGRTWFTGGRTYEVTGDTKALLEADGYAVATV